VPLTSKSNRQGTSAVSCRREHCRRLGTKCTERVWESRRFDKFILKDSYQTLFAPEHNMAPMDTGLVPVILSYSHVTHEMGREGG
jgi:hypothetical protein